MEIGDININLDTHMVYFLDEVIELTRKQYELLVYLIKHKNEIISREQLLNAVWDFDFVGDTRMVDIHISHLRDKLEKYSKNPEYIKRSEEHTSELQSRGHLVFRLLLDKKYSITHVT